MTKVINFFAGPGAGKSTSATGVFSALKQKNIYCEYVSEYAKDVTWEGTHKLLDNQLHIFSEQFRRQWRLQKKVDLIITDSPLLLSMIYFNYYQNHAESNWKYSKQFATHFENLVLASFDEFENINFYIERDKPYVQVGRNQTVDEAKNIDNDVKDFLDNQGISYYTVNSTNAIEQTLTTLVELKII